MTHRPPRDCPVCAAPLATTRLGCDRCGTELHGHFSACEFCALDDADRGLLRTFLASRGNMKELERHLGVSYPTARARFDALLDKLDIDRPAAPSARMDILEQLAAGEIDVDTATTRLGGAHGE